MHQGAQSPASLRRVYGEFTREFTREFTASVPLALATRRGTRVVVTVSAGLQVKTAISRLWSVETALSKCLSSFIGDAGSKRV